MGHLQTEQGGGKTHTLRDLRGNFPAFIYIYDGKLHDAKTFDILPIEPGAFYIMDRGYLDFMQSGMLCRGQEL